MATPSIAVVVIGRNEGERLKLCLRSIPEGMTAVYVDSGSTDGSVAFARSIGIDVVTLDMSIAFTAARARNAGWHHVVERDPSSEYIQFVDGDCVIDPNWLSEAMSAMRVEPRAAAIFGRRRERFPEKSIYNRMCDEEWNVPVGIVASCGGDALFRNLALQTAGGYSDDLIAGEEPDLCLRLRHQGWLIRRIEAEMTLHDADILTFGSWWQRVKRSGFAYAEHVIRHGEQSEPQWRRQLNSLVFWSFLWPAGGATFALLCGLWRPAAGASLLALLVTSYAIQIGRIAARKKYGSGSSWGFALLYGLLIVIGKFAEFGGALRCWTSRRLKRQSQLIEYKRTT